VQESVGLDPGPTDIISVILEVDAGAGADLDHLLVVAPSRSIHELPRGGLPGNPVGMKRAGAVRPRLEVLKNQRV
jgi:hypothetical protein